MSTTRLPTTLLEATRYFADLDVATEFFASLRWEDGPVCPECGGTEHGYISTRRLWKCKNRECRKQFSVKQGSIFEDSAIPLDKWLVAIWLIANSKNGISSHELGRAIGLTQKSAWFVLHRIRLAMQTGTFDKYTGEAEFDETFVGGKAHNKHAWQRARDAKDRKSFTDGKTIVLGARNRDTGTVHARVAEARDRDTLTNFVSSVIEPKNARVYTDAWKAYRQGLRELGIDHAFVEHPTEYVQGRVHTNDIEVFWALLKRGLHGTYVQVDPEHLFRYVDERVFTYNMRKMTDLERFMTVLKRAAGRRLTYAELTA